MLEGVCIKGGRWPLADKDPDFCPASRVLCRAGCHLVYYMRGSLPREVRTWKSLQLWSVQACPPIPSFSSAPSQAGTDLDYNTSVCRPLELAMSSVSRPGTQGLDGLAERSPLACHVGKGHGSCSLW